MSTVTFSVRGSTSPSSITVRFSHGRTIQAQTIIPLSVSHEQWDFKKGDYKNSKNVPNVAKKRAYLTRMRAHVLERFNDAIMDAVHVDSDWLKEILEEFMQLSAGTIQNIKIAEWKRDFTSYYRKYMEDSLNEKRTANGLPLEESTKKQYLSYLHRWEAFEQEYPKKKGKSIRFHHINKDLIQDFMDWCIDPNTGATGELGHATISRSINQIKDLLERAVKVDKIRVQTIDWEKVIVPKKEEFDVEEPALTEEEIEALKAVKFDLSDIKEKYRCEVRDTFVAACKTGFRKSDFFRMGEEFNPATDEYIRLQIQKTKRHHKLKPHPEVLALYRKYNGHPPVFKTKERKGNFQYNLRVVAKRAGLDRMCEKVTKVKGKPTIVKVPLHKVIAPHTSRRTFATWLYNSRHEFDLDIRDIMQLGGWKSEEIFLGYVKGISTRANDKFQAITG